MHTTHSDGTGTVDDIVAAAQTAGLDFVYVTDHNVLVRAQEEGYRRGVLTLVGQEVHDEVRIPQRNHLLCLGVTADATPHARQPQALIDAVHAQNGLTFLAHPFEDLTPLAQEHWGWENWEVTGYTGIELWNYMSSFRRFTTSTLRSVVMGFLPHYFLRGPSPLTLRKWDELTQVRPIVAIGGTDVHAWTYTIRGVRRVFLPYLHCARALNTHILTSSPLLGSQHEADHQSEIVQHDHALVLQALQAGHCWTGYDLAGSSQGFRFRAWQLPSGEQPAAQQNPQAILGDTLAAPVPGCVTHFRVNTPVPAEIRLLRNGNIVQRCHGQVLNYASAEPGVYRVEVWRQRWGRPRGWIFSNPIYVRQYMVAE
ncbi:MAG: CehA/McbA family metallohydrolase [Chloroflexota bacterium]|nr:CehA/McbA family metallohydrolase [Chloroflexota bacterium]